MIVALDGGDSKGGPTHINFKKTGAHERVAVFIQLQPIDPDGKGLHFFCTAVMKNRMRTSRGESYAFKL